MNLTDEQRAQLADLRDRYREGAALMRETAQILRDNLKQRGWTDEQIDAELTKPRRRARRSKRGL